MGGPVSQLVVTGAYSGGERLGARPPWIFRILRERALSLTTAIEKETKRKKVREKEEIYRFWSYDGQRTLPRPFFPPRYISLSPFLPFFYKKQKTERYFLQTTYSSL